MDILVKKAYENWMHVIEYDGKSLLNCNQNKILGTSQRLAPTSSNDYSIPNSLGQQTSIPSLPVPIPTGQPSMDPGPGVMVGGI